MSKNMKLLFAGLLLLATAHGIKAADHHHHLQCWHCSSDTIGAESFCDVDFSERSIPTDLLKQQNVSVLRSCNSTINSEHERAVCRKTVEYMNDKTITKRFCYYTNKSDQLDHCYNVPTEKNVKRIFCEDCLTDKCNDATQLAGMLGIILMPVLISKGVVV